MGLILDAVIDLNVKYTSWLGRRFDDTAQILENVSETLRWLAVLTRITP